MKRTAMLLALLVFTGISFAQDYTQPKDKGSDEIRTLFKKSGKNVDVGWTMGLTSAYTQFDKANVWLVGLTAGPVINHNWTLGIQLNAIVNSYYLDYDTVINNTDANLVGGYGGFLVQYTLFPKAPVHVTFPFQIGGGYLGYLSNYGNKWENGHMYWNGDSQILDYDVFFFVEPGIQVEFNLLKFMRLAVGASYRYSPDLDLEKQGSGFVNQFNATVGLKFGKF